VESAAVVQGDVDVELSNEEALRPPRIDGRDRLHGNDRLHVAGGCGLREELEREDGTGVEASAKVDLVQSRDPRDVRSVNSAQARRQHDDGRVLVESRPRVWEAEVRSLYDLLGLSCRRGDLSACATRFAFVVLCHLPREHNSYRARCVAIGPVALLEPPTLVRNRHANKGVEVDTVRPSDGAVVDEDLGKEGWLLQRFEHGAPQLPSEIGSATPRRSSPSVTVMARRSWRSPKCRRGTCGLTPRLRLQRAVSFAA
jgi:hypothetical protein